MTEKVIKHKEFTFSVPVLDDEGNPVVKTTKHGQEREKVRRVHARRHQKVDIPLDEDVERGEALGAFFTEEELGTIRGGTPEGEAAAAERDDVPPGDQPPAEAAPEDLNFDDHDMLVRWIRDSKPSAAKVVAAAGDDPDKAIALLDAEEEASGGQSRKSVTGPLNKIAGA